MNITAPELTQAIARHDHELGRCPAALGDNCYVYHLEAAGTEARALLAILAVEQSRDNTARATVSQRMFHHTGAHISAGQIAQERGLLIRGDGTRYCAMRGHAEQFCPGGNSTVHRALSAAGVGWSTVPGPDDEELAEETRNDRELLADEFHGRLP